MLLLSCTKRDQQTFGKMLIWSKVLFKFLFIVRKCYKIFSAYACSESYDHLVNTTSHNKDLPTSRAGKSKNVCEAQNLSTRKVEERKDYLEPRRTLRNSSHNTTSCLIIIVIYCATRLVIIVLFFCLFIRKGYSSN